MFVFGKAHQQSIFSGCKRLVTSGFIAPLKGEPQTTQHVNVTCRHRLSTQFMARRMCPLLIYQNQKQFPLPRPNFASHFVFHHAGFLRLPSWADQPLMPIGKLQALPNTVSRACALSEPVPRAGRAAAVPVTREQRQLGHYQVAPGLLLSCAGGKQRHTWEETKSETVRQEHGPSGWSRSLFELQHKFAYLGYIWL